MRNWERGQPDDRRTTSKNVAQRLKDFRAGVYMQTLLRDPAAGVMHSLIYFGFLVLLAVTTVLEINHQLPEGAKFLHGDVYRGYSLVGDVAGPGVPGRRAVGDRAGATSSGPYRIRIKSKPEHTVILGTFLALGVTGFGAEAFRIARDRPARLREVVDRRLPAVGPGRRHGQPRRLAPGLVARPRAQLRAVPG